MKRLHLFFFFAFFSNYLAAQTIIDYDQVKLDHAEDYRAANTFALQAANFLLSTPLDKDQPERLQSQKFLAKWMTGTPDYGFTFGESEKILSNNPDLVALYMASMVKFCLENDSLSKEPDKVKYGSWKILLAYCDNSDNHVRLTRKLKKLVEANKNGELEKEL